VWGTAVRHYGGLLLGSGEGEMRVFFLSGKGINALKKRGGPLDSSFVTFDGARRADLW